jgi:hypothetical protein
MSNDHIILKLKVLETLFEEGRKEVYSLRIDLERVYAPAPSGDTTENSAKVIIAALNKRRATFYKTKKSANG